jgi:hypothetical protein
MIVKSIGSKNTCPVRYPYRLILPFLLAIIAQFSDLQFWPKGAGALPFLVQRAHSKVQV